MSIEVAFASFRSPAGEVRQGHYVLVNGRPARAPFRTRRQALAFQTEYVKTHDDWVRHPKNEGEAVAGFGPAQKKNGLRSPSPQEKAPQAAKGSQLIQQTGSGPEYTTQCPQDFNRKSGNQGRKAKS